MQDMVSKGGVEEPALVLLRGCPKLMYTASLRVGGQELEAVIDTGSSNLVLMGADCWGCSDTPRCAACFASGTLQLWISAETIIACDRYRPGRNARDLAIKATADYSSQWHPVGAYGDLFVDTVSLPGAAIPNVTSPISMALLSSSISALGGAPVVTCAEANKDPSFHPSFPAMPALLGLNSGQDGGSFMFERGLEDLAEDALIPALVKAGMPGVFATHLCASGGFLWLGGYDRNHVAARTLPQYAPIRTYLGHALQFPASLPFYVQIAGLSVGSGPVLSTENITASLALVDTGNRFLELPDLAIAALNASVTEALAIARDRGYDWSFAPAQPNCMLGMPRDAEDLDSILPDLSFHLYAGENATVDLTMRASTSYMVAYAHANNDEGMWCIEVINVGAANAGSMGLPVMRNFITIFDVERGMIGFAPPVNSWCDAAPAPAPSPPPQPVPGHTSSHHWKRVLLIALSACAGAAVVLAAVFVVIKIRRSRPSSNGLREQHSQEGHPLNAPLID